MTRSGRSISRVRAAESGPSAITAARVAARKPEAVALGCVVLAGRLFSGGRMAGRRVRVIPHRVSVARVRATTGRTNRFFSEIEC